MSSIDGPPTATNLSIRPVEPGDREQWSGLYRGYRAFYQEPDDDTKVAFTWETLLNDGNESNSLVAVDDTGKLVGLAVWREFSRPLEADRAIYLDDLFVAPEKRGQGAGEKLILRLAELARSRNCSAVCWSTANDNVSARHLYDRLAVAGPWVSYEMVV